ncbi:MAG: hypothetical protein UY96_C0028G0009 [Parcubacteria group bacterium GW2011_GWB1_56_8]|nr:MAG: hypothetical protein UY96_C0028G0009 [Parcubacteria group bacterium GW2011_GWB1_56_8]
MSHVRPSHKIQTERTRYMDPRDLKAYLCLWQFTPEELTCGTTSRLADALNIHRETAGFILKRLVDDGLINRRGKHGIQLVRFQGRSMFHAHGDDRGCRGNYRGPLPVPLPPRAKVTAAASILPAKTPKAKITVSKGAFRKAMTTFSGKSRPGGKPVEKSAQCRIPPGPTFEVKESPVSGRYCYRMSEIVCAASASLYSISNLNKSNRVVECSRKVVDSYCSRNSKVEYSRGCARTMFPLGQQLSQAILKVRQQKTGVEIDRFSKVATRHIKRAERQLIEAKINPCYFEDFVRFADKEATCRSDGKLTLCPMAFLDQETTIGYFIGNFKNTHINQAAVNREINKLEPALADKHRYFVKHFLDWLLKEPAKIITYDFPKEKFWVEKLTPRIPVLRTPPYVLWAKKNNVPVTPEEETW